MNRWVEQSVLNVNRSGGKGCFVKRTRYLYRGYELIAEFAHNASTNAATAEKSYSWGLDVSGTAGGAALAQIPELTQMKPQNDSPNSRNTTK